jgi:hypothetical protein
MLPYPTNYCQQVWLQIHNKPGMNQAFVAWNTKLGSEKGPPGPAIAGSTRDS